MMIPHLSAIRRFFASPERPLRAARWGGGNIFISWHARTIFVLCTGNENKTCSVTESGRQSLCTVHCHMLPIKELVSAYPK